jgi:hypothetical protein
MIPARRRHSRSKTPELAYDAARQRIVLVRNNAAQTFPQSETWEYNPADNTWALRVAANGFWAGYGGAMEYDPVAGQCVHYTSHACCTGYKETWKWDGATWTEGPDPTLNQPFGLMAYDAVRERLVHFFSDFGYGAEFTASWYLVRDALQWSLLLPSGLPDSPPAPSFCYGLDFDTHRRAMVAVMYDFGGAEYKPLEVYEYRYLDRVVFDRHPQSQALMIGGNATFKVYAAGYGTLTYQWKRNGQNLADGMAPGGGSFSGTATSTLALTGVQQADGGIYTCAVSNSCGGAISNGALLGTPVPSDFDGDGDVDQTDLEALQSCASSPGAPIAPGCAATDLDGDGDADQTDFGIFQRCLSGDGIPADPSCMN